MPSNPPRSAAAIPSALASSPDPLLETQVFWGHYKTPILLGLLIALCLLAGWGGYRLYTARQDAAAAALLASAKGAADFQKVIADYPSSAASASASLLLAEQQRKEQKFAEANSTLQAFTKASPKHEFATTAKMAIAGNLESLGKPEEALIMYRRIAAENPRDFNAPLALLAEVHLLKQAGQVEEARRVCETVLTQYRESYAAQEAQRYLRTLKPTTPSAGSAPVASPVAPPTP